MVQLLCPRDSKLSGGKPLKRIISLFLTLTLFLGGFTPFSASASIGGGMESLGFITSLSQELLSYGLVYTELSSTNDKNQKAYIFEYAPNAYTMPQVEYGSNASSKSRLKDITKRYEEQGVRVVGAMNGDFFSFATGVPMGVVIKNGVLISSDPAKNAIGFNADGGAVIGNPDIHFNFSYTPSESDTERESYNLTVDYLNKYPSVYAVYFLNDAYSKTTKSTSPSTEIILKPLSGELVVNGEMTFEVAEINLSATNSEIPTGYYVLCGDDRSFASALSPIKQGDILKLEITADASWDNVVTALGGGDIIVSDGVFVEETMDEAHEKARNPRTAIGVRENGEVVFFANDGRTGNAAGVDLKTLAGIMIELDCTTVINLDGGGSTTVYATTPFDTAAKLVNNPSDGSERYVSNAILFLNNMPESDEVGGVRLSSDYDYMLVGSTLELDPIFHNKSYRPFTPQTQTVYSEHSNTKSPRGEFEENVFTALKVGKTTLSATNDGVKGLLDINVLGAPDSFKYNGDGITVEVGKSVPLNISAEYNGSPVLFNNYEVLNYKIREVSYEDEEIPPTDFSSVGYIADNAFCADELFEGILEISMEETTLEIPLKVIPKIYRSEIPYENITTVYSGVECTIDENSEEYLEKEFFSISTPPSDDTQSENLKLTCKSPKLDENAKSITFLSKNSLDAYLVVKDNDGNETSIPYKIERDYSAFNGWIKYKADLSEIVSEDTDYTVSALLSCETAPQNTIILGDFGVITDNETIYSDIESSWAKEYIVDVYYQELMKGKPYYTSNIFDGTATLTRAEFATILCRLMNIDLTQYIDYSSDFADMNTVGSWAWNQISAVDTLGIMSGSTESDGKRYFRPQDGITRAEAMQVFGRLIKSDIKTSELKFADADTVPAWAKDNAAKVVACNIFSGYEDNTIRPFNKLTRNEAAKVLSLFKDAKYYNLLK